MKQHPVPQNIASYQFRLVGDMTLKQFLELGSGLVLAYLIFSLKINPVIKLPLAGFFAFLGVGLAFVPIQERPLDQWLVNFIKSIYSPTRYIWKKNNQISTQIFTDTQASSRTKKTSSPDQASSKKLKEYLETLPSTSRKNLLDQQEQEQLTQIQKLLSQAPVNHQPASALSQKPAAGDKPKPATKQPIIKKTKTEKPPVVEPAPPLTPPIAIDTPQPTKQKLRPAVAGMFADSFAVPKQPEHPNIIVGVVLSPKGKIVPGVLIEIADEQGSTVRALKTNKLGQFLTATPLEDGQYQIKLEHDDYNFDIIKFQAEGKIIPPLKIQAESE